VAGLFRRLLAVSTSAALLTSCLQQPPQASVPTASTTSIVAATAIATPPATASAIHPAWVPVPRTTTTGCVNQDGLPDAACSPGAIDPRVNQADIASTICVAGYTKKVRPSESVTEKIKRDQMAAYGLQDQRLADYELDHLISLELGSRGRGRDGLAGRGLGQPGVALRPRARLRQPAAQRCLRRSHGRQPAAAGRPVL
jgi:hypothetical protein